jgi:hypothetical protein
MAKAYRLPVPIKPETRDAIERLANATNASIGATAAHYLDELAPQFIQLAEAFEMIKTDPAKGVQLLQKAGFEAQRQLTEQQLLLIEGEGK